MSLTLWFHSVGIFLMERAEDVYAHFLGFTFEW